MRWQLTNVRGAAIASAKTTKERDAQAFLYLGRSQGYGETMAVIATDTRTGRVVELSRPLKRKTITKGRAGR